jgi:hypothetical protein
MTTSSDVDYFKFTVPSGFSGTLSVKVQSSGLSQLAPTLTVYNASQQQIGFVSGNGQYGTTLNLSVTGLTVGQPVYIRVAGAEASPFGTGSYGMALKFGTAALPTIPLVNTQLANGNPPSYGGGLSQFGHDEDGHDGHRVVDRFAVPSAVAPTPIAGTTRLLAEASGALVPLLTPNPAGAAPALPSASSAVTTRLDPLVVSMQADLLRQPTRYVETRYSGTGTEEAALPPMEEDWEETLPGVEPTAPGPVENPVPVPDMMEAMPATGALWRWASETCFANTAWRAGPCEASDPMPMALAEGTQDLRGLLAAAAVVVGGAWGAQPDERRWSRRPRL